MIFSLRGAFAIMLVGYLVAGCGRYEYDLVQPTDLAQHIAENQDAVFSRGPLLYRLSSDENHLVLQIQNQTSQALELQGGRSFAVDPQGQSHPLPTETLAPQSFIKIILPALVPEIAPAGPVIGFGFGVSSLYGPGYGLSLGTPLFVRPGYYASADMDNAFWKW